VSAGLDREFVPVVQCRACPVVADGVDGESGQRVDLGECPTDRLQQVRPVGHLLPQFLEQRPF
jgi:hypothetical protein